MPALKNYKQDNYMSKIIVIAHHLSVPGTEDFWEKYSNNTNHKVVIVRPRYWKDGGGVTLRKNDDYYKDGLQFNSFNAPFARYSKQNLYFFVNFIRYFLFIKKEKPNFIYVMNTTNSIICLQTIILGKLLGIKVICWASRLEPRNFFITFGPLKGLIFSMLRSINKRLVDAIHATSTKAKEALIFEGHHCPIYIAPTHGIPPHFNEFRAAVDRSNLDLLTVGYAGELLAFKGVDILINAISRLPSANIKLKIAGVGPEKCTLEKLATSLDINAEFLGYIDNLNMPEFYRNCDIIVLPSKGDGPIVEKFGRVLIEAAACGCAVIGSNVGGIPLAVGQNGILFKDGSVNSLSSKLEMLIDQETLAYEKNRSHKFATSNYSMDIVAKRFYKSVVKHFK